MFISEIYLSNQGEGQLTGTPSVFVRTSGCNLRCGFCDTPFASWEPTGETMSVDAVLQAVGVNQHLGPDPCNHVVLTGGEPMLPSEIAQLCDALHRKGLHITIETAGTIYRDLKCDLLSVSPQLSNSTPQVERAGRWLEKHEQQRHRPEIVSQLIEKHDYQLKFVVAETDDVTEIKSYLSEIGDFDRSRVLLMPEGVDTQTLEERQPWLEAVCETEGFTFCQRQHIFWYGNKRGT